MHAHTITLTLAVGLAALAPTAALAQPAREAPTPTHDLRALASTTSGTTASQNRQSPDVRDAAQAAQARQDLRPPDVRDAAEGRGTDNSPRVVIVKLPPSPAAAPTSASGIDWADAGIGAGSLLGLSLIGAGGAFAIAHRRRAAHGAPPIAHS